MTSTQVFHCPHCEQTLTPNTVNWTSLAGPRPSDWLLVMLSCPFCQKALGPYVVPQAP